MGFVDSTIGADVDVAPTALHQLDDRINALEAAFVTAAVAVVCLTSVGLVAAMLGVFSAPLAVVGGAIATALLLTIAVRQRSRAWTVRWRDWTLLPPVAVIALISTWSATHTGQTLLIGRDPGSYLNTARWLARDGSLSARGGSAVLDGLPGVNFAGPAVYDMGGGNLEFQFSHGAGVALATMYDLFSARGLFNANILVGAIALLGWYCVLRRLDVGRSVSLAAIVALGISIPYLNVTRATYSEPYVLLLAGASLLMLVWAPTTRRPALFVFFAGLFAGGTVLFRIDGLLYLAALFVAVAVLTLTNGPRTAVAALAGAAVPSAIGIVDQQYFTGNYATDLADSVRPLAALTVVSLLVVVGALVVSRRHPLSLGLSEHSARILGIVTSSVVIAAWLIRPLIETSTKARSVDHPGLPDGGWTSGSRGTRHRRDADVFRALRSPDRLVLRCVRRGRRGDRFRPHHVSGGPPTSLALGSSAAVLGRRHSAVHLEAEHLPRPSVVHPPIRPVHLPRLPHRCSGRDHRDHRAVSTSLGPTLGGRRHRARVHRTGAADSDRYCSGQQHDEPTRRLRPVRRSLPENSTGKQRPDGRCQHERHGVSLVLRRISGKHVDRLGIDRHVHSSGPRDLRQRIHRRPTGHESSTHHRSRSTLRRISSQNPGAKPSSP